MKRIILQSIAIIILSMTTSAHGMQQHIINLRPRLDKIFVFSLDDCLAPNDVVDFEVDTRLATIVSEKLSEEGFIRLHKKCNKECNHLKKKTFRPLLQP